MDKVKTRDNLQVPQKNIEYGPNSTSGPDPLNDQSDKIRVSVREGKEGSSTSSGVETYSKSHD